MKIFTITKNDASQRLDRFITKNCPELPAALMFKYIRIKRIKVNGKRAQINTRLSEGDTVEAYINDEFLKQKAPKYDFMSAPARLNIVYEDENILLADKPQGLLVHPDKNEYGDTLIARIQRYLYEKGEYRPDDENSFRPALANRIDRNTGGIVIAAKNAEKNRVYLKNKKTDSSLTIKTRYRVIASKNGLSIIEIDLLTGRTHQIRAHMASIGHPLLGDGKYGKLGGDKKAGFSRQALYSYRLKFAFTSDAEPLNYLNGKEFKVNEVWFAEQLFPEHTAGLIQKP